MMFSSTIIALKLLPTSALHHQRMGELIVSILLLQDMLAIAVLLGLESLGNQENLLSESLIILFGLPMLVAAAWWFSTKVLTALSSGFPTKSAHSSQASRWRPVQLHDLSQRALNR